jgi:hypothetical protein
MTPAASCALTARKLRCAPGCALCGAIAALISSAGDPLAARVSFRAVSIEASLLANQTLRLVCERDRLCSKCI